MLSLLDIDKDYVLTLSGQKYTLLEKVGCGGSSVVYKARPVGGVFNDYLIIKEFLPYNLDIKRERDGSVCFSEACSARAQLLMRRTERESEIVDKLREDENNNNPWFLSYSKPIVANNTLYTIIRTESGNMLSEIISGGKIKGLSAACRYTLCILDALEPIHKKGYLHLDVAPDNIHISELGVARLIDYNSAFHMSETPENLIFSYKKGYSAKELTDPLLTKPVLSPATDLYSVTAIFFEMLKGRAPEDMDFILPSGFDFGDEECLRGASELLVNKIQKLLKKGLASLPGNRFQSVSELRDKIIELLQMAEEKSLVNRRHFNPGYGRFVGREDELGQIGEMLCSHGYVYLEGMGGIGKTELAKKYAEINRKKYDFIQFVKYDGSLKSTIGSQLEFQNFHESFYDKTYEKDAREYIFRDKLKLLEKHDERTLIIVDNYNTAADNDFNRFVSGAYKVIFTSRIEHAVNAVTIGSMSDPGQLFAEYYKPKAIAKEDVAVVQKITDLLLGHTMAVELVAAALSKSGQTAQDMFERLKNGLDPGLRTKVTVEKEEISAEERKNTIFSHIRNLFDMSEVRGNPAFAFIMANMSILPYTGITANQFYQWALAGHYENDIDEAENDINELIERRWLQSDASATTRKISLHPIVSDVAREELKPDSEKCGGLIKGITEYSLTGYPFNDYRQKLEFAQMVGFACLHIPDDTNLSRELLSTAIDAMGNLLLEQTPKFLATNPNALSQEQKQELMQALKIITNAAGGLKYFGGYYAK